jgi:ribosomal protein L11 methyltransferase
MPVAPCSACRLVVNNWHETRKMSGRNFSRATGVGMTNPRPFLRPDSLLYIYYIDCGLPADLVVDHDHFLGNWIEGDFSFLFFAQPADDTVADLLVRFPACTLLDKYTMTYEQWQGGQVEPLRIGRFLINPTWIKASPQKDDIALTLDSGLVFGNGTHPTTQACLEAMEVACSGKKVTTVLDLGGGTGILALAAAKLGCRKVLGVDFNYLAATTAHTNVRLNDLAQQILIVHGKAEEHLSKPADLLIANIHFEVMKELVACPDFTRHKWFVLSGLLTSEAEKIVATLRELPVLILKKWCPDNIWHTILGITVPEA